jgi:hypothetical protein
MNKHQNDTNPIPLPDPQLLRLLRSVGRGPVLLRYAEGSVVIVVGEAERRFPQSVLETAISSGLLRIDANHVSPTENAAPFLKRAMTKDREEIFQEQHRECETVSVEIDGARQSARRNAISSPLMALLRLKDRDGQMFFPAETVEAGERLAGDFHRGHLSPRITASWEPRLSASSKVKTNSAADLSDTALAARLRFSRAADAMGPELAGVAIDVCCFEKGLEAVERERQWPVRSAKLMLRAALQALARHYAPPPVSRKRESHHWGAEDYRPNM